MSKTTYTLQTYDDYLDKWKAYSKDKTKDRDSLYEILKWLSQESPFGTSKYDCRIVKKTSEEVVEYKEIDKEVIGDE